MAPTWPPHGPHMALGLDAVILRLRTCLCLALGSVEELYHKAPISSVHFREWNLLSPCQDLS